MIDLTHSISANTPTFDGDCGFTLSTVAAGQFRVQRMEAKAGIGTHMDAPAHCIPGGKTIETLPLEDLLVDCAVIKIEEAEAEYVILPEAVEQFEKEHGRIQPRTFVIFHTGWDRFWNEPERYVNGHNYPSVDARTAKLLLSRDIAGLGIDTLSADKGTEDFPVHQLILGAGKYLVENIANAKELSPTGAKVLVLPMKIEGATEAPIRLIALL